jgi:hypothetical protein
VRLFVPYRRATLLIPSGTVHDSERKHLFIVVTDPAQVLEYSEKQSLLVCVTTLQSNVPHDPACILYAGDHPFIRHKSFVYYAEARIEVSQKLINGIKQGVLVSKEMLAEDIFARVCKGLVDSRFTAPRIRSFYEAVDAARKNKIRSS